MDVSQILAELRREKDQLEEAILSLERLVGGTRQAARASAEVAAGGEGRKHPGCPAEAPRPTSRVRSENRVEARQPLCPRLT